MSEQQTPMTAIARTDEFRAVWTLNRMREIVLNEMLMHGEYSTAVVDERRAEEGAVCGGRRACAVGSLWIAYGVPFDEYGWLEGVRAGDRNQILSEAPPLRIAYDALNAAAERYVDKSGNDRDDIVYAAEGITGAELEDCGWLEMLFESGCLGGEQHEKATQHEREVIISLIDEARNEILAR